MTIFKDIGDLMQGAVSEWFKGFVSVLAAESYVICLSMSLICLLLYILGEKKAGKYIGISIIVYVLFQGIVVLFS